jgi:hypothetical protein
MSIHRNIEIEGSMSIERNIEIKRDWFNPKS